MSDVIEAETEPTCAPAGARVAAGRATARVSLDLVVPLYNEATVLPLLLDALRATFDAAAVERHGLASVRCVFVDDGSVDDSVALLRRADLPGVEVQVVRLSRNFGHQAAVTAGLASSSADLVAVLDADLQDPPACVLEMIDRWRAGYEVVYGVRRNRKEGALKVGLYWAFYRVYRLLSPIAVPVDSGDFCLMSRRVVDALQSLPERLRFPRGLRTWVGFAQTAVAYDRPARAAGESRYGWRQLYELATEGLASLSLRPLQLAQGFAILYFFLTIAGVAAILFGLLDNLDARTGWPLMAVLILLSNSVILFCLYILGAYVGRGYLEVKGRPTYIVADIISAARPEGDA